VGNAAAQLADGIHLLRLTQLALDRLAPTLLLHKLLIGSQELVVGGSEFPKRTPRQQAAQGGGGKNHQQGLLPRPLPTTLQRLPHASAFA
jgi:hypothetical protein